MAGFVDKLGDLSWLGDDYADMGWVQVGEGPDEPLPAAVSTPAELAWDRAKKLLADSDWTMMSDVPMTVGQKSGWIAYRKALREIRLQPGFPNNIQWPKTPE